VPSPTESTRSAVIRGAVAGLIAAALFGASAPLAKVLLPNASPLALAAVFYLGGGLALTLVHPFMRSSDAEAPLRRADLPMVLATIAFGGMVGPVLMLIGLGRVSAVAGSLLLNLEGPLTILLAVAVFREHLGRRELGGVAGILGGAALLTWGPGELHADPLGIALLAGACASWAIDNNLSQKLSARDPIAVARAKTLGAGSCMLVLALLTRQAFPPPLQLAGALAIGGLSYGASIALHLRAMRTLGAARQAALFATAPFIGALLAVPIAGERLGIAEITTGVLMAGGVAILLRERHAHEHVHEALEHDHAHEHDDHHAHAHEGEVTEPHSHVHAHVALTHDHPHVSDLHHRHDHAQDS